MSFPSGASNRLANSLAPEKLRRQGNQHPLVQPAEFHPAQHGLTPLAPPKFSGIGNLLNSPKLQDAFLWSEKEGSSSILLPESSVIIGRSAASYKRDGWLELQERLPEEVAVAAIWLYGVDSLQKIFERNLKGKLFPRFNHLSSNIAWNPAGGKLAHVDLTPQEMFAKDHQEISSLLKIKSTRWVFSVGLALGLVAYAIPKLNQWKTNLLLQYLSRRKRQTEGSNVQFGDPSAMAGVRHPQPEPYAKLSNRIQTRIQTAYQAANHFNPIQFPTRNGKAFSHQPATDYPTSNFQAFQYNPTTQPNAAGGQHFGGALQSQAAYRERGPQFGGLPGGSLIQALGHMVEQTPYGSILVVDAGIAGGRGYVASKRSLFETAEVIVRDIGSLYFYILFAPHMMKALGALADKAFGTSIGLQPKVADELQKQLLRQAGGNMNVETLRQLLQGASESLLASEGTLKKEMRLADGQAFRRVLEQEARVYLPGSNHAGGIAQKVLEHLHTAPQISPAHIQGLLHDLQRSHGPFAALSELERKNLGIAVKQAFRHTAGIALEDLSPDSIRRHPAFSEMFAKLEKSHPHEIGPLTERIRRMARLDALDQTHSMLRRSLNAMREAFKESPQIIEQGHQLADWINQAVNRRLSLSEMIAGHPDSVKPLIDGQSKPDARTIRNRVLEIMDKLSAKAVPGAPEKALLDHYRSGIGDLMSHDKGRLFSLAIEHDNPALGQKVREMLKGGLENDSRFLSQALDIVGQLETDSRKFSGPEKAAKMRESIVKYSEALMNRLHAATGKISLQQEMEQFYRLNRNLHYGAWTISLAGTMLCLGWLVPKVQTSLTKRLTGKDKNPGIAQAETANEKSEGSSGTDGQTATGKAATEPVKANAFTETDKQPFSKPLPSKQQTHYPPLYPQHYNPPAISQNA